MKQIRYIFEDTHLAVLCKPSGLLAQGDHTSVSSLVDLLRVHFGRHYVGLVHRLDRNTSGLMVVAKRSKAANRLTNSLQNGEIKRKYHAWVEGDVYKVLHLKSWLIKDEAKNQVSVFDQKRDGAKFAELTARPIKKGHFKKVGVTLLEIELQTGRSHQIRAQLSHIHHPVLGDLKYGGARFERLALHSFEIEFPHPMTGERLHFSDDLFQNGLGGITTP